MLVDEHAEVRELLAQYLIMHGLIPMPVPDGAHALVVGETLVPDAVLFDLPLPDTEGLALIGHIKAQHPSTPLVVISGWHKPEGDALCRARGADDVLPKPIDLKRLGQTLTRLLRLPEEQPQRAVPPRPAVGRRARRA
jgi:DNA-binding response OmpR family regulator